MTKRFGRRGRESSEAVGRRVAFLRAVGDIDPRLELEALLQRVADVALAVGARTAAVGIRDGEVWKIVQAGKELDDAEGLAAEIAEGGRVIRAVPETEAPGGNVFGFSLRGRSGTTGALWVITEAPLSEEDAALVESLAQLVAAAVADATLFASEAEREEQTRRHERAAGAFTSMVSHELRSPLAAIRGFGRLLLDRAEAISPEERREFLEAVVRQADHMAALVDDVLDVAQMEAGAFRCTMAPFDARGIVDEAVAETTAAFPGHPVSSNVPAGLPPAQGDAARLKQVLLNLLSNACRYSPENTDVFVSVDADASSLTFGVSDRGPGVPAEDRERIFERFGRLADAATRRTKGAGLGLFIARQIVEMHGGRIWVEPDPAGGSTFRFAIPSQPARA